MQRAAPQTVHPHLSGRTLSVRLSPHLWLTTNWGSWVIRPTSSWRVSVAGVREFLKWKDLYRGLLYQRKRHRDTCSADSNRSCPSQKFQEGTAGRTLFTHVMFNSVWTLKHIPGKKLANTESGRSFTDRAGPCDRTSRETKAEPGSDTRRSPSFLSSSNTPQGLSFKLEMYAQPPFRRLVLIPKSLLLK